MTMRLTIKNEDDKRTATVMQEDFKPGEVHAVTRDSVELGPHKSRAFYIHAGSRLTVTENPDATQPRGEETDAPAEKRK